MYKTLSRNLQRKQSRSATPAKGKSRRKNRKFTAWQQRQRHEESIKVGMIFKCRAVEILDFGVVVDIGNVRGFLHISEISHKWIKHPAAVIQPGQKLKLKVIAKDINKNGRCSIKLSKKAIDSSVGSPQKDRTIAR